MFELARYPVRATWGSHREEFGLSTWDPKIHELFPSLGTVSVRDPVVPSIVHSHAYGPLYGIELKNAVFDPRDETVIVGNRRIWEFGEPKKKSLPSDVIRGLRSPRHVAGDWTPIRNSSFAHWILEDLPSALLSVQSLNAKGVLISRESPTWQRRILDEVDLPWNAISHGMRVERIVFVDRQTDYGWPRRDLAKVVVDRIRNRLTPVEISEQVLYVSNAGGKRANAMSQMLDERAVEMGYKVVRPENLSWLEQASLFAAADKIIAPHGGALANLIFCNPGTQITELMSRHYANPYFEVLSRHQSLDYERCWLPSDLDNHELMRLLAQ